MVFSVKSGILSCYDFNKPKTTPIILIGNTAFYKDFIKKCASFVKKPVSAQSHIQHHHKGEAEHIPK